MIKNAPIVNDTRRVRRLISENFNNNHNKYIDYLLSQKKESKDKRLMDTEKKRVNNAIHPDGNSATLPHR